MKMPDRDRPKTRIHSVILLAWIGIVAFSTTSLGFAQEVDSNLRKEINREFGKELRKASNPTNLYTALLTSDCLNGINLQNQDQKKFRGAIRIPDYVRNSSDSEADRELARLYGQSLIDLGFNSVRVGIHRMVAKNATDKAFQVFIEQVLSLIHI